MLASLKMSLMMNLSYTFTQPFLTTPVLHTNRNRYVVRNSFWWTLWYSLLSWRNLFLYDIRRWHERDQITIAWVTMDPDYMPVMWVISHEPHVIERLEQDPLLMQHIVRETAIVRDPVYASPNVLHHLEQLDRTIVKLWQRDLRGWNMFISDKRLDQSRVEQLYFQSLTRQLVDESDLYFFMVACIVAVVNFVFWNVVLYLLRCDHVPNEELVTLTQ